MVAPVALDDRFSQIERKRIRSAVVSFDMPTSPYWRGVMKTARKALRLTQGDLGELVGTSQPTISDIELGHIGGSGFVPAICMALQIPLPVIFVEDDFDQRWVEAGRVLRERSMTRFRNYLAIFEEEAGITVSADETVSGSDAIHSTNAVPGGRRR
jgi:transcriptional regulator with XRE-family HTH domain